MNEPHRTVIYLDIETIPGQQPFVFETLQAEAEQAKKEVKAPANYKSEAAIWEYEQKKIAEIDQTIDAKWRKTSFDGALGQIVAISLAINDEAPINIYTEDWAAGEMEIISRLYDVLGQTYKSTSDRKPIFVGHNVIAFDLRFLFHRSAILGIRPPAFVPFDARPWDDNVFDTMVQWAGVGNRISLDKLCRVFGIPTKGTEIGDEIDGSKVWDYVQDGRIADVALYCGGDVERVRMIYKRLTFDWSPSRTATILESVNG